MSDRIIIFDTTLRDGEQSPGATMNTAEKVRVARQLETLGVDVLEAGFPAASHGDFEAVQAVARAVSHVEVAALCRSVPADIERAAFALKVAKRPRIHTFIATSPLHMKHKLRKEPAQVLDMAKAAVSLAAGLCPSVEFSCEDASRSEIDFLAAVVEAAIDCGATTINIPDTVGYAQPHEFAELLRELIHRVPNAAKAVFSVHCHNDLGLAVANTLAALHAGARQAEVTLCGIGERAGNASLEEVVMALRTRESLYGLQCGVQTDQLFPSCRLLSMITGIPIGAYKAIIGANAFAHESGIHQDGVLKCPQTYEIMTPESVGRAGNDMVLGKHSGRAAIKAKCEELGFKLEEDQINLVAEAVKRLADTKKQIFAEDLESLVLEEIFRLPDRLKLTHVGVVSGTMYIPATASLVLEVEGVEKKASGFGVGPIDAVFHVISKVAGKKPKLLHYAVNAITGGTDAQAEVTVRIDVDGRQSVGRGAHGDVIVASARAFVNALNAAFKKEEDPVCDRL